MGPDNGEVIFNDPNHGAGAIAKYTCDPGYVPAGDTIRCCVRSQNILMWTGEDTTCVRKLHLVICRYMYIYTQELMSRPKGGRSGPTA